MKPIDEIQAAARGLRWTLSAANPANRDGIERARWDAGWAMVFALEWALGLPAQNPGEVAAHAALDLSAEEGAAH